MYVDNKNSLRGSGVFQSIFEKKLKIAHNT